MDTDPLPDPNEAVAREYRAITLAHDGRVREVRLLWAGSDSEAIAQAETLVRDCALDLWDGLRFVEHVAGRPIRTGGLLAAGLIASG